MIMTRADFIIDDAAILPVVRKSFITYRECKSFAGWVALNLKKSDFRIFALCLEKELNAPYVVTQRLSASKAGGASIVKEAMTIFDVWDYSPSNSQWVDVFSHDGSRHLFRISKDDSFTD